MTDLYVNITIDNAGVRLGSKAWFAAKDWTARRKTWDEKYIDVVTLSSTEGQIVLVERVTGWQVNRSITSTPVFHDLAAELNAWVDDHIDELTTDSPPLHIKTVCPAPPINI